MEQFNLKKKYSINSTRIEIINVKNAIIDLKDYNKLYSLFCGELENVELINLP